MPVSQTTKATLFVLLGNTIFGLSFLATKVALNHLSPLVLITSRFLLCFLVMNLLLLTGRFPLRLKGKNIKPLLLLGLCQPILYFIGETYGIMYSSSSFSGMMIALIPAVAFVFAVPLLGEPFKPIKFFYVLCSLGGIVTLSLLESSGGNTTPLGILLLSVAVLAGAFYNIVSRKASVNFTAFERTYIMFALGAAFYLILTLVVTKGRYFSLIGEKIFLPQVYFPLAFLGIMSSVVAFLCLNYGITYLPVQKTTSFTNITTIVSVIAGTLVLHEAFTLAHGIASLVILVCVYLINRQ